MLRLLVFIIMKILVELEDFGRIGKFLVLSAIIEANTNFSKYHQETDSFFPPRIFVNYFNFEYLKKLYSDLIFMPIEEIEFDPRYDQEGVFFDEYGKRPNIIVANFKGDSSFLNYSYLQNEFTNSF